MKKNVTPAIILLPFLLCAAGCASPGHAKDDRGTLQGMIYDFDNRPVSGYLVSVGTDRKASTDINGRFIIPDIPPGAHTLTGEGPSHSPCTQTVVFADKTQIIYLRVPSNAFLYAQVDRQLSEGGYDAAMVSLRLFSAEEQKSKKYNLYKTIALFRISPAENRSGYYARARKLTEELLNE